MNQIRTFVLFSEYNQLMNQRLYLASAKLPDEKIKENRKAFFKSLFGTLNHIFVGDIIWLKRFSSVPSQQQVLSVLNNYPTPKSLSSPMYSEFKELRKERQILDALIVEWAKTLTEESLSYKLTYTNMMGISFTKDYSSLINHLFLHQIHHRGQATTLLSQFGVDFGETDLIEIIK